MAFDPGSAYAGGIAELGVAEAIQNLREELFRAFVDGRDELLRFEPGPIELELQLGLTASAGTKVRLKWVVLSIGGEAKAEYKSTHRVKLTLKPVLGDAHRILIGNRRAQRPK